MEIDPGWFGRRLRELRAAKDWTQQDLAEMSGVSLSTLRDMEQGKYGPSWGTLVAIANAMGFGLGPLGEQPSSGERPGPGRPRQAQA